MNNFFYTMEDQLTSNWTLLLLCYELIKLKQRSIELFLNKCGSERNFARLKISFLYFIFVKLNLIGLSHGCC